MKKKWSEWKDRIVNAIKFTIFTVTGIVGFFFIYTMIWLGVRIPFADWSLWVLFALAMLSEWLFVKWLSN
jgi:hypothetical protein